MSHEFNSADGPPLRTLSESMDQRGLLQQNSLFATNLAAVAMVTDGRSERSSASRTSAPSRFDPSPIQDENDMRPPSRVLETTSPTSSQPQGNVTASSLAPPCCVATPCAMTPHPPLDPAQQKRFEHLYELARGKLFTFCRNKTNSVDDAEDLLGNALQSALSNFSQYDSSKPFANWFYGILRNRLKQYWSKADSNSTCPIENRQLEVQPAPQVDIDRNIQIHQALKILRNNYPANAEVVERHHLSSESLESIAETLDIPVGTVKSRLFEGRKHLRAIMIDLGIQE